MTSNSYRKLAMLACVISFCTQTGCITNGAPKYTGNPLLAGKGVCDPGVRVFNDKLYLYATQDTPLDAPERNGNNHAFHTVEWWVWSSENLVDWKQEGTLSPTVFGFPDGYEFCWATDALSKDGKYFWYVCNRHNTYVAVSETPHGPWESPRGDRPLMAGRDPAPFIDDDGIAYLVTGVWNYKIAQLGDDLISLAETPRKIVITNPEGPYGKGKTDDKAYLHKQGDWYYLSWGCFYAMSKDVYGPYECKGSFLRKEDIDPELLQEKWNLDRHGSFFEWKGKWYFMCNNQRASGQYYRNTVICDVQYKANGEIVPIKITKQGVKGTGK